MKNLLQNVVSFILVVVAFIYILAAYVALIEYWHNKFDYGEVLVGFIPFAWLWIYAIIKKKQENK